MRFFSSTALGLNDDDFMEEIRLLREQVETQRRDLVQAADRLETDNDSVVKVMEEVLRAVANIIDECQNNPTTYAQNPQSLLNIDDRLFDRHIIRGFNIRVNDALNVEMPAADLERDEKIQAYHQYFARLAQDQNDVQWVSILKKTINHIVIDELIGPHFDRLSLFCEHEKMAKTGFQFFPANGNDFAKQLPQINLNIQRNGNAIVEIELDVRGGLDFTIETIGEREVPGYRSFMMKEQAIQFGFGYKVRLNDEGRFIVVDYHEEVEDNCTLGG